MLSQFWSVRSVCLCFQLNIFFIISEVGRLLPAGFGIYRISEEYNPHKDIRKNLPFFQDLKNEVPTVTAYV